MTKIIFFSQTIILSLVLRLKTKQAPSFFSTYVNNVNIKHERLRRGINLLTILYSSELFPVTCHVINVINVYLRFDCVLITNIK